MSPSRFTTPDPHYSARVTAPRLNIVRESFAERPGLDTAVSRALLLRAADGAIAETFRLHVPGRVLAFGKRDTLSSGYREAVSAARAEGYEAVERLAGGRAAVFHEASFAFSWAIPDDDPPLGITQRFEMISSLMTRALRRLGVDAEVGELPGEYCPGAYSVHGKAGIKLMGVGQRLTKRAAHIGGVVVVGESRLIREILTPVYAALDLTWDPGTAGAIQDVVPAVTLSETADAILAELAAIRSLNPATIDRETLELAKSLTDDHVAG